ncbi:uncharacterized protein L201_002647 [Kwoniella dendrophila CBS 6074]|uniref:RGS domain-containing protein n=1 Tax=Kwoniella dendrophila CBS 6074 TaxID=1295534 RepID=A0AAX4JT88_9TREE
MSESTPAKASKSARKASSVHTVLSSTSTPLARFASSSTAPVLEELKLSNILNGDTCPPISFIDFASFVANKEYTTENLLFILWYRSYKDRFEKLEQNVKETIPIPSTRLGDRYNPYGYLDKPGSSVVPVTKPESEAPVVFSEPFRSRSISGSSKISPFKSDNAHLQNCPVTGSTCYCPDQRGPANRRASRLLSITHSLLGSRRPSSASHPNETNPLRSILHQTSHPPLPPTGTVFTEPSQQPMREEAQRAFATFLKKGGSRELSISDELREYTKICLARSTAPEVFLPLYEEIYHVVEYQSLPHFLQHARSNINRPKQVFWYMVGAADFGFGCVIYLLLTLLLPAHPFGLRAWRLFSMIFASFGAMQFYSAWRGFCSQVWGRSHRQVRPWEMDDLDDEETLVESDNSRRHDDMELREESFLSQPVSSIHREEINITLPEEVRPLADLGGVASIPSIECDDDNSMKEIHSSGSPALSKSDSITVALPVLENNQEKSLAVGLGLSDIEKKRMEIRRSTVKVPNASEAFPISDDMSPQPPRISFDSRQMREISPFAANDINETILPSSSSSRGSINFALSNNPNLNVNSSNTSNTLSAGGAPLVRTKSRLHSLASQRANKEITNILLKLRKTNQNYNPNEDENENYIDPTSSATSSSTTATRSIGNSKTLSKRNVTKKGKGRGGGMEEKKPKVFGPEKLVEDPRIKKVYSDIKRDILIVGSLVASIWIVLCLAVPCAGLAS